MAALLSFVSDSRNSILALSIIFMIAIFMLKKTQKIARLNGTKI